MRLWTRQAQIDANQAPGATTEEQQRIRELERENRDLKQANEIVKSASIFFAREYSGVLELVVNEGNPELSLTWELLVAVFESITAAGLTAYLDVDLGITSAGRLGLWPMMVGSHDLEVFDLTPDSDGKTYHHYAGDHPELVEQITAVLGASMEYGFWQIL